MVMHQVLQVLFIKMWQNFKGLEGHFIISLEIWGLWSLICNGQEFHKSKNKILLLDQRDLIDLIDLIDPIGLTNLTDIIGILHIDEPGYLDPNLKIIVLRNEFE